ncbi:delta subunit of the central stalk of mitochondrial F1F0 ATP synthase, atp16 [Diplodia seriata]|uniref:Carboxylic ester hydrolase n=1 Tax=Diplodia seriata TaxID=420778 RepID=A0ABR3CUR7_9PEZI
MVEYLNEGFAVAGGDSGHLASDNNGGEGAPGTYLPYLHDPDQVQAWIHDSIALFTHPARGFIKTYYAREAEYSYYYGCSTGGAQGFALSQLHPGLFDGIYAGCPGFWYSHLALSFLWNGQHTEGDAYLSQSLLDNVTSAVLDQCDELDGVVDGLLENPLACNFSIDALACDRATSNSSVCLNAAQLAAAKAIYAGPRDVRDKSAVYPGFSVGSESEWAQGQEGSLAEEFSDPILQNLVYDNLTYASGEFDWGSDIDDVDSKAGVLIDETSTDLRMFRETGSKMLVSQGWADPYNAATMPIEYLKRLQTFFEGDVSDFFSLYMVPAVVAMNSFRVARTALRAARPAAFRAPVIQRRGYAEAANDKLKLSLALPHQAIFKSSEVVQVNIAAESGDMGLLADHVPAIEQLKPGVIEVVEEQSGSKSWFASGGFAVMQPNNNLSINAVEAYPLEDFSAEAVRNQIAEAQKVASGGGSEVDIAEAQIELEVLESLQAALK